MSDPVVIEDKARHKRANLMSILGAIGAAAGVIAIVPAITPMAIAGAVLAGIGAFVTGQSPGRKPKPKL